MQKNNLEEFPLNPDDWIPLSGVKEELKAKERTDGRHRQWKNEDGIRKEESMEWKEESTSMIV